MGIHEDPPGERATDLEKFARRAVAVATGARKIGPVAGALEVEEAAPIVALKLTPSPGALII